jgi:hypothetical protein
MAIAPGMRCHSNTSEGKRIGIKYKGLFQRLIPVILLKIDLGDFTKNCSFSTGLDSRLDRPSVVLATLARRQAQRLGSEAR